MNQVQRDKQLILSRVELAHNMIIPNFLIEILAHMQLQKKMTSRAIDGSKAHSYKNSWPF